MDDAPYLFLISVSFSSRAYIEEKWPDHTNFSSTVKKSSLKDLLHVYMQQKEDLQTN